MIGSSNMPAKDKNFTLGVFYLFYPQGPNYQKEKPICALRKILSGFECKKQIIYINNAIEDGYLKELSGNDIEIGGDNSALEFSGWQKGIEFARRSSLSYDAFLLVNDTFLYNSFFHRSYINQSVLDCAVTYNAVLGAKMRLPVSGSIMGNPVIPYLRTHIFIAAQKTLSALGSLVSVDNKVVEKFFIPTYDPDIKLFRQDAEISQEIRDYIFSYVTSIWYRKQPYELQNFETLKNKSISMLNALLFSLRVRQLGYPLISFNKAARFLSAPFSMEKINEAWFKEQTGDHSLIARQENKFWFKNQSRYQHLPKKKKIHKVIDIILRGQINQDHF